MNELDPRLIEIVITVGANNHSFTGDLAIRAQGVLFANPLSDTCEVTLYNLTRANQDYILNVTSPYSSNHEPKTLTVKAGRQSYGLTSIYQGTILLSSATQPPDIGVILTCLSGASFQNIVYNVSLDGISSLDVAINKLAERMGAQSDIQIENAKMIGNYNFNGTAIGEMAYLNSFGNLTVFYNQGKGALLVKDAYVALTGTQRVVSEETGMIGVPEWTELGVKVIFLIDNKTQIGGGIRLISKRYPAFSGDYAIFKLGFNLASRETPFYYIAEAARVPDPTTGIAV